MEAQVAGEVESAEEALQLALQWIDEQGHCSAMNRHGSSHSSASSHSVCPFLGTVDTDQHSGSHIEYPSFENRCLATARGDSVMLTDQATFCLSSGHQYCPRFVAAPRAKGQPTSAVAELDEASISENMVLNSEVLAGDLHDLDQAVKEGYLVQRRSKKRWGWIGASMVFIVSLLCGGLSASYVGWQLVNSELLAIRPGTIDTLASAPAPAPPQVYLIVTATSEAPDATATPSALAAVPQQASSPGVAFPQAVTPTAIIVGQAASTTSLQGGTIDGRPAENRIVQAPAIVDAEQVAAAESIQLTVPTRRPTPILDIVANTPVPDQPSPTPTWTPTIALGTPIVIFAAQDSALTTGKCTTVTWHVENVRAVFYENLGVNGHGEKEECLRDSDGDYLLTVVLEDGSTKTYTETVELIVPTETPTATPTFTPESEPTATWTPIVPTDTPTPDRNFGAILDVEGGSHQKCGAEQTCEVGLLITNTSNTIDNLTVEVVQSGAWSQQLCRLDGVCSESRLNLVAVGPSNTAFIRLVISVPSDASAHMSTYAVRVLSDGSNGTAGSDIVGIEIEVE